MRLAALASFIPDGRIEAEEIIRASGGSAAEAKVFRRMFGLDHVSAARPDESLTDHFGQVTAELAVRYDGPKPDTLIHVRGLPLRFPAGRSPMHSLRREYSLLSEIERQYEIDQTNCTGLFWALDFARILLEAGIARSVAVLAGDSHAGLSLADRYVPGCTLMGDAFCGLILDLAPNGVQIGEVVLHSYPEFSFGYNGEPQQMGAFFAAHGQIVRKALEGLGFDWEGRGAILPHNVNRLAWHTFSRETGIPVDRIRLDLLPDVGHCYTSDPFLLLDADIRNRANARRDAATGCGNEVTLVSVGMGGFVAACRLMVETSPSLPHPSAYLQRSAPRVLNTHSAD